MNICNHCKYVNPRRMLFSTVINATCNSPDFDDKIHPVDGYRPLCETLRKGGGECTSFKAQMGEPVKKGWWRTWLTKQ